ncbi:S-adenosyl-l-methionine hydroxide adenosyltransferase family protein [Agriterribacter sp.]|uniref:SAM hydrolase/SAM-dependent halogenase family protein n=1 Tax=Agriterribacter sp. TaxID=2821509 RepID=UPI002C49F283|nr:S-adenosyl-l-methionine hydroxide adenosyltransferase family protein [Agriterribacter sp.]HRO47796.1 S-adenosyl-l-methionine hydroxide adenosyltransferase family protein [Agriterribacter sp.]HRQ18914.1 S-adenosyl-l-methionine hydroxide adenosyltransferase family protein [Agriterribacter sp.]
MRYLLLPAVILLLLSCTHKQLPGIVLQTDFGVKDGAVAEMKGVIFETSPAVRVFDLTHEIPPYNIRAASYRLQQTAPYWPPGTIFVSVVDPGVGTLRKPVVMKTLTGHYFVSPDNGSLTEVAQKMGIAQVRQINETLNRRPGSEASYTFHGRDIFAYTAAKLAAGKISFEEVGPELPGGVIMLLYQQPVYDKGTITGNIPVLDPQYGNIWTNIDTSVFKKLQVNYNDTLEVKITHNNSLVYAANLPYLRAFGEAGEENALVYINSLMNVALAINMGNLSEKYKIGSGTNWNITLKKH